MLATCSLLRCPRYGFSCGSPILHMILTESPILHLAFDRRSSIIDRLPSIIDYRSATTSIDHRSSCHSGPSRKHHGAVDTASHKHHGAVDTGRKARVQGTHPNLRRNVFGSGNCSIMKCAIWLWCNHWTTSPAAGVTLCFPVGVPSSTLH